MRWWDSPRYDRNKSDSFKCPMCAKTMDVEVGSEYRDPTRDFDAESYIRDVVLKCNTCGYEQLVVSVNTKVF